MPKKGRPIQVSSGIGEGWFIVLLSIMALIILSAPVALMIWRG